ncbi:MAG: Gfo/Idh/MocA family protein [Candidatus Binatia bacterium]
MTTPENKRLALVGAGGWGRNLARSLKNLRGARLAAVCDSDPAVLARLDGALDPATARCGDFGALVADGSIDAIVLATPPESHHRLACAALRAGKDVMVEKPLTLLPDDADELVRLAEREGRVLMVGHLLLYHPGIRKLREIALRGDLGEIRYLHSQRVNLGVVRTRENSLWSLAPHDVAVAMDLFGETPATVTAQGASYLRPGVEDVVFAQLHFPSGKMAAIHVSWLDPHKERRLTIVGSRKMAVFDDMEPTEKLRIYDRGVDLPDYLPYGEALTLRFGDILIPAIESGEPLVLECQHFVDRLHDRARPRSDGRSGLEVVRALAAATESLRRGGAPIAVGG